MDKNNWWHKVFFDMVFMSYISIVSTSFHLFKDTLGIWIVYTGMCAYVYNEIKSMNAKRLLHQNAWTENNKGTSSSPLALKSINAQYW